MGGVVDLPRVRRALSALDAIAAAQGLRPGDGHFTEADVRAMLQEGGQSVSERQRAFRERKRAAGWVRRGINLSPDAQEALEAIRARDGATVDEAVARALLSWAGQTERGKP